MFTELETERLYLKNISRDDREFILAQFSDDEVNEYLFDADPMTDISEADSLITFYTVPEPRDRHRWILVLKNGGEKIGTCGFHYWDRKNKKIDIGYDLQQKYRRSGYMTEAVGEILNFIARTTDIECVNAHIYIGNRASMALADKLGFRFYGETETLLFRGNEYFHRIYSKTI